MTLDPVRECELHESAGVDDYDRDVTGVWLTTDTIKEKTYMSIEKVRTIMYIDDVNPVSYDKNKINDDWEVVGGMDENDNNDNEEKKELEDDVQVKLNKEVNELRVQKRSSLRLIEDLRTENDRNKQDMIRLRTELRERSMSPTNMNSDVAHLNERLLDQRKSLEEKQKEIDRLRRELKQDQMQNN
eukprot:CAMPEP_0201594250 /NCGR_PEP_ID=MMETSP0190_2-20130828/191622_1 /ASSEMBLY_ACC=CAM_ASM_000263 /TAXON_ID=37353 /ORGANISM="Rosalina sp." /LENGTH=185 /DNA_ID=CAMNT_0048053785 /DNA_START=519 /DNA_END=1077 /DNA_ORIENTATION=-